MPRDLPTQSFKEVDQLLEKLCEGETDEGRVRRITALMKGVSALRDEWFEELINELRTAQADTVSAVALKAWRGGLAEKTAAVFQELVDLMVDAGPEQASSVNQELFLFLMTKVGQPAGTFLAASSVLLEPPSEEDEATDPAPEGEDADEPAPTLYALFTNEASEGVFAFLQTLVVAVDDGVSIPNGVVVALAEALWVSLTGWALWDDIEAAIQEAAENKPIAEPDVATRVDAEAPVSADAVRWMSSVAALAAPVFGTELRRIVYRQRSPSPDDDDGTEPVWVMDIFIGPDEEDGLRYWAACEQLLSGSKYGRLPPIQVWTS